MKIGSLPLFTAGVIGLFCAIPQAQAQTVLTYCSFELTSAPCTGAISSKRLIQDPVGRFGNGAKLCSGTGCTASTTVQFNQLRIGLRRGTVAFWVRANANPKTTKWEFFDTWSQNPLIRGGALPSMQVTTSTVTAGAVTTIGVPAHGLPVGAPIQISGATGAWAALNQTWTIIATTADSYQIALNSSAFGAFSDTLTIVNAAQFLFRHTGPPGQHNQLLYGAFTSDYFFWPAGQWQHVVWTWTADRHRVYRNGAMMSETLSQSPLNYYASNISMRITRPSGNPQDATIDEFGSYDYEFSPAEVASLYNGTAPGAASPLNAHGMQVFGTIGAGQQAVKFSVDSGNDYQAAIQRYRVELLWNGSPIASNDVDVMRDGFAEGLLNVTSLKSGSYQLRATSIAPSSVTVSALSPPMQLAMPSWLGNTYGISNQVNTVYWDPVTAGAPGSVEINVVKRTYQFTGGFGLPVQILSEGQPLLAQPIALDIIQGGLPLTLQPTSLTINSIQPNLAKWTGTALAGGSVRVTVDGTMEHDGMMLLSLKLEPLGGPVSLDAVRLRTTLTQNNAVYTYAVKDSSSVANTWIIRTPVTPGEYKNNLGVPPVTWRALHMFSVVLSGNDRGLQMFHNHFAGWQINETLPWQRLIRDAAGTVTYQAEIANQAFTLSAPNTVQLGYLASPTKRLPPEWRLASGGAALAAQNTGNPYAYYWDFNIDTAGWATFDILPQDLAAYKSARTLPVRAGGQLILPYVNARFLDPTPPVTQAELDVLQPETQYDGSYLAPTRGVADFWAFAMNRLLNDPVTPNVVDGYYIDESYAVGGNPSLLSGAGYIKPDGSHGVGFNMLAERENYKRLASLLTSAGKAPNLWFHDSGRMFPHVWSWGLMVIDGELPQPGVNFYIDADSASTPDHFDFWNDNNSLLDPTQAGKGPWLLSQTRASRWGMIPMLWKGIECCYKPAEAIKVRRASCLTQLHDVILTEEAASSYAVKSAFGLGAPDVTYNPYWSQLEAAASDPKVKVSYYKRQGKALAYIANFNAAPWTGPVQFNLAAMGLASAANAIDAEGGAQLGLSNGSVNLTVNYHDCRIVQLQ